MNVLLPIWARDTEDAALRRLVHAAMRADDLSDEELTHVLAFCEQRELSGWLWERIEQSNFKGAGELALCALYGWIATDDDICQLGELVRAQKPWTDHTWSRIAPRRRALAMLHAAGERSALARLEILRFWESTRIEDLYRAATGILWVCAQTYNLEPGEFAEMCAPPLGFDDGRREFDYGPRQVTIDLRSWPQLRLPRRRETDDDELVTLARKRWKWTHPQLEHVWRSACARLERAMVCGRQWRHFDWRDAWYEHPITRFVATNVVWTAHTDHGLTNFVLTGDGEALGADLDPVELNPAWALEVAHPTSLDVARWTEVLAELQLVQPFEQIGRSFSRPWSKQFDPGVLAAASQWGWDRRARAVGRARDLLVSRIADLTVSIVLKPGLTASDAGRIRAKQRVQHVAEVRVHHAQTNERIEPAQWPARVKFEIDLLLARAAL